MRFRVATFNMLLAEANWHERRELIVAELAGLQPDVLCLNEVDVREDTGRWLWQRARAMGQDYVYLEHRNGPSLAKMGQAILTRLPITESVVYDYRSKDRVAQVARLDVAGAPLDVYVTHLHHVRREPHVRDLEVQRLLEWIDRRDAPAARLVCGDFNAEPDSRVAQQMQTRFVATQYEPTFPTRLRYAPYADHAGEPEDVLFLCFDYIWYQPPLRLLDQGRCFDQVAPSDRYLWPSDHIGLWADFELG